MTSIRHDTAGSADSDGLIEMSTDEVTEVLRQHQFGRIAFAHESWPVVLPVNYAFDSPNLVVRTAPGAKLTSTPLHAVAFEVDDVDPKGTWGWSVLIQGPAFDITEASDDRSTALRNLVLQPAAPGIRENWLMITTVRLTGRYYGHHPLK